MKILQRITAFFTALILLNCPAPAFSAETGNSEDTSFLSGGVVVPGWGLIVIAGCLIFLSGTVVYGGIRFRPLTRTSGDADCMEKCALLKNFYSTISWTTCLRLWRSKTPPMNSAI